MDFSKFDLPKAPPWLPPQPAFDFSVMVARENAAAAFLVALVAKIDALSLTTGDQGEAILDFIRKVRGAFLEDPDFIKEAMGIEAPREPLKPDAHEEAVGRAVEEARAANTAKKTVDNARDSVEYQEALRANKIRHLEKLMSDIEADLEDFIERDRQAQTREDIQAIGLEIRKLSDLKERTKKRLDGLTGLGAPPAPRIPRPTRAPASEGEDQGNITQGELDAVYEAAEAAKKKSSAYQKALAEAKGRAASNREYWQKRYDRARGFVGQSEEAIQAAEDGDSMRRHADAMEEALRERERAEAAPVKPEAPKGDFEARLAQLEGP